MNSYDAHFEESWTDGKSRNIYLDEDHFYGWWRKMPDAPYNYVCVKDINTVGMTHKISSYLDSAVMGFINCDDAILMRDGYGFEKYDRYLEIYEVGCEGENAEELYVMLGFLTDYARYLGARFIRFLKKESFPAFYAAMGKYAEEREDSLIIEVDNPVVYDDYVHLRTYSDDAISFDELTFLKMLKFTVDRERCYLKFGDEELSVGRRDRVFTFPSFVKNKTGEPITLSERTLPLAYLFSYAMDNGVKPHLTVNVRVEGVPYELAEIEGQRLFVMHDLFGELTGEDATSGALYNVLSRLYDATGYEKYSICTATLKEGTLYHTASRTDRSLKEDVEDAKPRYK